MPELRPFNNFPLNEPKPRESWFDFMGAGDRGEFTATAINSGTATDVATFGGAVRLSGAATTDDSGVNFQLANACVYLQPGEYRFRFRLMLDEATSANVEAQSDLAFGIAVIDTSIIASAPTDGIYCRKDDGDALLGIYNTVGSVVSETSASAATLVSDTWYEFDLYINITSSGAGTVTWYKDGVLMSSVTVASGLPASTAALSPFVAFQSGDNTGTKYVDVDYIGMQLVRDA